MNESVLLVQSGSRHIMIAVELGPACVTNAMPCDAWVDQQQAMMNYVYAALGKLIFACSSDPGMLMADSVPTRKATAPAPPEGLAGPAPYTASSDAATMARRPSQALDSTQFTAL